METGKENVTQTQEEVVLTPEQKLNEKRKVCMKADLIYKIVSILVIALSLAYAVGLFMGFLYEQTAVRVTLGIVLLLGILFALFILPKILKISSKYNDYSMDYKNAYLKPVFEQEFPKAEYKETDKISTKEISECSLLKKARSANANDCVSGSYEGVDFTRCDVELSYGKSKSTSDCVLIACNSKTILKGEMQAINNKFSIGGSAYEKPEQLLPYISGDESFDKKFKLYVENREEADKVLSDSLRKKLSKFAAGGPIAVFFDKQKVYLVIRRNKDSMEAPVYKAAKESSCRKVAEREVVIIKKWIDLLNDEVMK